MESIETFEEQNLNKIELLLSQSMRGIHHLFDKEVIAKVLQTPTEDLDFFRFENMDKIQNLFNELIERESHHEKILFLETLSDEEYEVLLRTYFHILDSTVLAATTEKH